MLLVFSPASCSKKQTPGGIPTDKSPLPASFVIGLLPEQNVFLQKRRYEPLADYLSKTTGMDVRTKLLDSYESIYNEMLENKVDAAFFGSLSYVAMDSRVHLEPIARPYQKDGVSTYRGFIFALKGNGITEDIRTWKNKRIALVNKSTTAGYLFPKWHLYKQGVKGFEGYFSKVVYTGSHDAAILAVLNRDVDIGCAKDLIFNKFLDDYPQIREKLIVLASSAPVPSNTLAVRENTDARIKESLRNALFGMEKTPEGKEALSMLPAERFIPTKESEYNPVHDMLKDLGLKPSDFALGAIAKDTVKLEPSGK